MRVGWREIKMVDACDILTCGVASTPKYVDENIGVPFLSAQNVRNGKVVLDKYKYISQEFHEHLTKKNKPQKGDILYSRVGAKFGEAGVVEHDFEFSVYVSVTLMRPKPHLFDNYFFKNYLNSPLIKDLAKKSIQSSGVPNLNVKVVREFPIPIPPLPEQRQIVSILDKAFAAIDQAKANIERNIENAKELFQSELGKIFISNGTSFKTMKLKDICEVKDGTHYSPKYVDEKDGIPFVTQKNVLESGLTFEKTKFISKTDHEDFYRRSNVSYKDILIAMIGANRGMACIVDDKRIFSIKNVGLIKASKEYIPEYLVYFLKSPIAKHYVSSNSRGSAQGFIGLGKLREFPIPYAEVKHQVKIVERLNAINKKSSHLIEFYSKKLGLLQELKKSILQKAFAGELTNEVIEDINIAAEPKAEYATKN